MELENILCQGSFYKCGNERLLSQYNRLNLPNHMSAHAEYAFDISASLIVDTDVLIGLSIKSP